ncbi:MAG: IclR family transcriptional regulator [Desulfobacteraceae bacterium]|nr:IclR family transcriptional regulator [Desulfobacteraceae bacterium]
MAEILMKSENPTTDREKNKNLNISYKAPAVHKAFQLLRVVAKTQESLGIVDLAKRLGYSKSTTHGLVHALLREGVLTQGAGGRKLYLGPTIAELMFSNWHQERVNKLARPILNDIRDTINETVILGVRIRHRVLIISTAETQDSLKISVPIGSTIPLFAGAVGKVFLSAENNELAADLIKERGLPQYTPRSITDEKEYLLELDRVGSQGYAVDVEEYLPGIRAVAVAVNNRRGLPAAIWVVGMSATMEMDKIRRIADLTMEKADIFRRALDEDKQAPATP